MPYSSNGIENLPAGRTYVYQIKLLGSVGSANYTTVKAYTFPDLSGFNLTYQGATDKSIQLSWTNIGYTFVSIQNTTIPSSPVTTYNYTSNVTLYDSSGVETLSPDQSYSYKVTLSNERGDSVETDITVYTLPTFQGINMIYDVSNSNASSIQLTWTNTNKYTSISLQNVDISGSMATSYTNGETTYNSTAIDSLLPSHGYQYRVIIQGSHDNTNTMYMNTYTHPTLDGLNIVYDISNSSPENVALTWENVGEYTTIQIQNTTKNTPSITYTAQSGKQTYSSLTDGIGETLSPGQTYQYSIVLANAYGTTVATSVMGYTLPSLTGFNLYYDASNSTVNSVFLGWTNTNYYTSIAIQNQSIADSQITTYTSSSGATSYNSLGKETTLIPDVSTTYLVTLYNDNGSSVSQSVTAYTLPTFDGLNMIYDASNSTNSSVQFHWVNTGNYSSIRFQNTSIKSPIVQTTYTAAEGTTTYDSTNKDILIPSKTYVYTVTIYGSYGNTNQTTLTVYTLPSVENTLIAYNYNQSTNTNLVIEWVNSGYTTLSIQNMDISGTLTTYSAASNTTRYESYGIDNLYANTVYNYLITATNDAGYTDSMVIRASTLTIYDALHMAYIPSMSSTTSVYLTWSNTGYRSISLKNNTVSNGVVTTFTTESGLTSYDSSGVEVLVPGKAYRYLITLVDPNGVVYNTKLVTAVTLPSSTDFNLTFNRSLSSATNRYFSWTNTGLFTKITIQNTTTNGTVTAYKQTTKSSATPMPTFYDSSGTDTLTVGTLNTYQVKLYNDYDAFVTLSYTDTVPYITGQALSSTSIQITFNNYYTGGITDFNVSWSPIGVGTKQTTASSNVININGLSQFSQYTIYGVITYSNGATFTTSPIQLYTDVPEPIKWYKFEPTDICGNQLLNYGSSTTAYDTTKYNTASVISTSNYAIGSGSFAVNGNTYFRPNSSMLLNTANSYSISFWVYGSPSSSSGYLLTMYGPNTGYYTYLYGSYNNSDKKYHVSLYNTPTDVSMNASAWNHIVLTFSPGSSNYFGSYLMYVNGTQYNYNSNIQLWPYYNNVFDFYIGSYYNGGGNPNGVFLDDVRIFNYQLSPTQVSYLYNVVIGTHLDPPSIISKGPLGGYGINVQLGNYSPLTTSYNLTWTPNIFTSYLNTTTSPNMNILGLYDNTTYTVVATTINKYGISSPTTFVQTVTSTLPVIWYKFDASDVNVTSVLNYGNGSQLYDANYSNTNNVINTTYTAVGSASMYANGNTRLQMNNTFLLNPNNHYSVSFWLYGQSGIGNPVFGFDDVIYMNTSWQGGTPAKLNLSVSNSPYSISVLANQWNHIALTFGKDISSNIFGNYVLYVNGVPNDLSVYIPNYNYYGNSYRLYVCGNSQRTMYNGFLDDFRVYNYQLTPSQITAHYTSVIGTSLNAPTITTSSIDASGIITVVFSNYSPLTTGFNVSWSPSVPNSYVTTTTSNTVKIMGLHTNTKYTITATTTNKFGTSAAATATQSISYNADTAVVWYKFNTYDIVNNFGYTPGLYFKVVNGYYDQGFLNGTDMLAQNNWYQAYYDQVYNYRTMQPYATDFTDISGATKGIILPNTIIPGFMVEWVGYFYPPTTGNYIFNSKSSDFSIIWLYNNIPPNTTPQANMQGNNIISSNLGTHTLQDSSNTSIYLNAGIYYPIRIRYGSGAPNITDSMIYYYKFNNGDIANGQIANYAGGSANYGGTIDPASNTTISTSIYKIGNGSLYGGNRRIVLPGFNSGSTYTGFTFAIWYRYTTNTNVYHALYSFGNWSITLRTGDAGYSPNILNFLINGQKYYYNNILSPNTWYHIVFTLSASSTPTLRLYLNGSLADSTVFYYPTLNTTYSTISEMNSQGNGTNGSASTIAYYDEFRVYSRELSPTEISVIYNYSELSSASLGSVSSFDYKLNISVNDVSLNMANTSSFFRYNDQYFNNQGPWYMVDYANGNRTPYVTSQNNSDYLINTSNYVLGNASWYSNGNTYYTYNGNLPVSSTEYSVACWLYPQPSAGNMPYSIQCVQTGLMLGLFMNTSNNNNIWTSYMTINNAINTSNNNAPMIPLGLCNQWYHVVMVWTKDPSSTNIGSYIIYVNGVAYDASVYFYNQTFFSNTTYQLKVGSRSDNNVRLYNTYMDDFRMYNYAMSGATALNIYNSAVGTALNAPTITVSSIDASGIITVVFSNYSSWTTSFNLTWKPSIPNSYVSTTTSNTVQIKGLHTNTTYTISATTTNKFGVSAAATATQTLSYNPDTPYIWYKFNTYDLVSNFGYTPGLYFKIVAGYADQGFNAGNDIIAQNNWNQNYWEFVYNSRVMQPYSTDFTDISSATLGIFRNDSSSNFMIEWVGYFYPPTTGNYTFNSRSGDFSIIWLYNNIPPNTTPQANMDPTNIISTNLGIHVMQDSVNTAKYLMAGTYYPIRIRYGNKWGNSAYANYRLTISVDGQPLAMNNASSFFVYNDQYFNNQGPWYMVDYANGNRTPYVTSQNNSDYLINTSNYVLGNASWYSNGNTYYTYNGNLPVSSTEYSVACWLYPQPSAGNMPYSIQCVQTGLMLGLFMNTSNNNNVWTSYMTINNAINTSNNNAPMIPLGLCNQWYHVVMVWTKDPSSTNIGSYIVYVNGVAYDASVYFTNQTFFANTTYQLKVGSRSDSNVRLYNTYMDDFRMYNYALSSAQVKSVYASVTGTALNAPTITTSKDDTNGTITVVFSNYSSDTTGFNLTWSPTVANSYVSTTTSNTVQIKGLRSNVTYTISATTTSKYGVSSATKATQSLGGNNPLVSYKFDYWDVSSNANFTPGLYFTVINGSYGNGNSNGVDMFTQGNYYYRYIDYVQSGKVSPVSYNFYDLSSATNGIAQPSFGNIYTVEWIGYFRPKITGNHRFYNSYSMTYWVDRRTPPTTDGNVPVTPSGTDPYIWGNNVGTYLRAGHYYPFRIRLSSCNGFINNGNTFYVYDPTNNNVLNRNDISDYFFFSSELWNQQTSWYMTDYGNGGVNRLTSSIQNFPYQPYLTDSSVNYFNGNGSYQPDGNTFIRYDKQIPFDCSFGYTLSVWGNFRHNANGCIFSLYNNTSGAWIAPYINYEYNNGVNSYTYLTFGNMTSTPSGISPRIQLGPVYNTNWCHIAITITKDPSSNNISSMILYVNTVPYDMTVYISQYTYFNCPVSLYVGCDPNQNSRLSNVFIDDFNLFTTSYTQSEIISLYHSNSNYIFTTPSLSAWWNGYNGVVLSLSNYAAIDTSFNVSWTPYVGTAFLDNQTTGTMTLYGLYGNRTYTITVSGNNKYGTSLSASTQVTVPASSAPIVYYTFAYSGNNNRYNNIWYTADEGNNAKNLKGAYVSPVGQTLFSASTGYNAVAGVIRFSNPNTNYLTIPNVYLNLTNAFTLSIFMYGYDAYTYGQLFMLYNQANGFNINVSTSFVSSKLYLSINNCPCPTPTFNTWSWNHFAFTFAQDLSSNNIGRATFYLNGVPYDITSYFNSYTNVFNTSPYTLTLGADINGNNIANNFALDELKIFDTEYSASQITGLYSGFITPAASTIQSFSGSDVPINWYKFDIGDVSTNTVSLLNYGNNTTLYDASFNATPSYLLDVSNYVIGNASLYLDGSTYFNLSKNITLTNTNGYTISFWFKYSNTTANPRTLFYIGNGGGYWDNNNIYANVYYDGNNYYINTQACGNYQTTQFSKNTWNHLAITFAKITTSTSTKTAYFAIYLNGVKRDFTMLNMYQNNFTYGSNIPFYVGNGSNIGSNHFLGNIDDFRVYNYNLSQDQITSLYSAVVGTNLNSNTLTVSAIGSTGVNVQFSNYPTAITTTWNVQWTPKILGSYAVTTSNGIVQIRGLIGNTTYKITGTSTNTFGVSNPSATSTITLGSSSPQEPIVWYKFNPGDISANVDIVPGLYYQAINGYYDRGYNGSTDGFWNANTNYHYVYYSSVFNGYTSPFSSNFTSLRSATNNVYIENQWVGNFSIEWIGYFNPPTSGSWQFSISANNQGCLWLSPSVTYPSQLSVPIRYDTSVNMIASVNIGQVNNFSQPVTLTAGVLYPIRIRYGVGGGGFNFVMTATCDGVAFGGDFSGCMFSSPRLAHTNSGNTISYINNYGGGEIVNNAYSYSSSLISASIPPVMGSGCAYFDGNTFVAMETPFVFQPNTSYTFSMWFNYSQQNNRMLFYLGNNNNIAYDIFAMVQYGGYGGYYISTQVNNAFGRTNLPIGSTWNHIAMVIKPNSSNTSYVGNCAIFINGVKMDFSFVGNNPSNTMIAYNQPYSFFIGNGTGVNQSNYIGYLDDFRIYNYALTDASIQSMYSTILGTTLNAPSIALSAITTDASGVTPVPAINVRYLNYAASTSQALNVTWTPKPYNSYSIVDISSGTVNIVGLLSNTTYTVTATITTIYGITSKTTSTITIGGLSPQEPIVWYKFNQGDISANFPLVPGLLYQSINGYYDRGYNGSTDGFWNAANNYHYVYNNSVFNGYSAPFVSTFTSLRSATNNVYIENQWVGNFSIEWIGYFNPPTSGSWQFSISANNQGCLWLSPSVTYSSQLSVPIRYDTSVNMIASVNIGQVNNFSQPVTLTAGVLYPIRIRYGVGGGGFNFVMTATCNGVAFGGDFSGCMFTSPHLINNNSGNVISYINNYGNGSINANAYSLSDSSVISSSKYLVGTGSAYFDGTKYVTMETPFVFQSNTSYTFSMWFNFSDYVNNRTLFYMGNNNNPVYNLWVHLVSDGTNFYIQNQAITAFGRTQFQKSAWTHLAIVFSDASGSNNIGKYTIYVNGVASNLDLISQNGYNYFYYNQQYRLYLGNGSNVGQNNYVGYVDDFKIYNTGFSAAQIQQIYSTTVGTALNAPTITLSANGSNAINVKFSNYDPSTTKFTLKWTPNTYRSYVSTDASDTIQILGLFCNTTYTVTAYTTTQFGPSATTTATFTTPSSSPILWFKFNQGDISGNFALKSGLYFQVINGYYDRGYNGSNDMFNKNTNTNYHYLYNNSVFYGITPAFSTTFNTLASATNNLYLDNRGVNNFSVEWIGYFKPPTSGTWQFSLAANSQGCLWLSPSLTYPSQASVPIRYDTSDNMIASVNIGQVNNFSQPVILNAGVLYPIRIRYGVGGGGYNFTLTATCNGVAFGGDFTGAFFSSERLSNNNSGNVVSYINNYGNDAVIPTAYSYTTSPSTLINTTNYMMGTGSAYFDGTNFVSLETPFQLYGNTSYTFSLWFNYSDTNNRTLFYLGNNSNPNYDLYIYLLGGSNTLYLQSPAAYATSRTAFTRGVWNHIGIVIDPSSNTNTSNLGNFALYLNGVKMDFKLVATNSLLYFYYNQQYSLYLGNGTNISQTNYIGYIDDFRIYNTSYTSDQIQSLYNAIVGNTLSAPTINVTPIGTNGLQVQFTNYSPKSTNWTVTWSPKIINSYVTTDASNTVQILGLYGNTTYTITATTTTPFGITTATTVTYTLASTLPVIWYKFNQGDISNTMALKPGLFFQVINGFYNRGFNGNNVDMFLTSYTNLHGYYYGNVLLGNTSAFANNFTAMRYATNNVYLENQGVNNFNIEWIGYFKPPSSGTWQFFLTGHNQSGVWIDTTTPPNATSVPIYPQGNNSYLVSAYNLDNGSTNYSNSFNLSAGYYYPIRIRYGQTGGGYDIRLTASYNGLTSSDFTGYFYSCERLAYTNSGTSQVNYIQNYGNGTTLNTGFTYGDTSLIYTGKYIPINASNASAYFNGSRVFQHESPFYFYSNTSYTFSMWFYYQTTDNRMMFYLGNNSNAQNNLYFAVVSDGTNVYLQTEVNGALYKTLFNKNTWNHLAVVISPNSSNSRIGNFYMYLNNVKLDFSVSSNANNNVSYNTPYNFYIGNGSNVGWTNYSGFVDDFRIYNSALTDSQISQLYTGLL